MVTHNRNRLVHAEPQGRYSSSSNKTLKLQSLNFRKEEETHPLLGIRHLIQSSQQPVEYLPSLMSAEAEAQRCYVPWPRSHTCYEAVLKFPASFD